MGQLGGSGEEFTPTGSTVPKWNLESSLLCQLHLRPISAEQGVSTQRHTDSQHSGCLNYFLLSSLSKGGNVLCEVTQPALVKPGSACLLSLRLQACCPFPAVSYCAALAESEDVRKRNMNSVSLKKTLKT